MSKVFIITPKRTKMEENKRLILEKNLLNVFEKYGDLQIKYNKDDKHYIDIKIDPYVVCLEYNWNYENKKKKLEKSRNNCLHSPRI